MRISTIKAKIIIKCSESLRLTGYRCPAGKATIGYGHTRTARIGETITAAKAEYLLDNDIEVVEIQLNAVLDKCSINQNQFDALVSLVFNIGIGRFLQSTLLKLIKVNPDDEAIAFQFVRWIFGGDGQNNGKDDDLDGHVDEAGELLRLPGLIIRRQKESDLYFDV
jgi:lysozyme